MSKVDVVFATYNSGSKIETILESLVAMADAMKLQRQDWQVIVANNNSSDNTRAVLERYSDRLPLQIVEVPTPGKSYAINATLPLFKADLIVFTDDDVKVHPDWLAKMLEGAARHPDYAIFSGRIVGVWDKNIDPELMSWVPMTSTFAVHKDTVSGPCDPGIVWGPNFAVRRSVLETGQRFNTKVGPTPDEFFAMGEDTEFAHRLVEKGFKCFFIADAVVEHAIKPETIKEDWIVRRAERLAYGLWVIKPEKAYDRRMPALPLQLELWVRHVFWGCIYPMTLFMPKSKKRFWLKWRFYYYRGLYKGYKAFV